MCRKQVDDNRHADLLWQGLEPLVAAEGVHGGQHERWRVTHKLLGLCHVVLRMTWRRWTLLLLLLLLLLPLLLLSAAV